MREAKECEECGGIYFRPANYTDLTWNSRRYCGQRCATEGIRKRRLALKAALTTPPEEAEEEEQREETRAEALPLGGIVRELRVVRVGPNPRMVVCEYYELAERRLCTVDVKRNAKWVKGMRFSLEEPRAEAAYNRPWVYDGRPPRWRGRF